MSWHPASYGAGKRHWYVTRGPGHEHEAANGRLIWYGSLAAAQGVADRLNEADWESHNLIDIDPERYAE